jgi:CYTH domain-containing protein
LWQIDKAILDRHRLGANEPFVHAQFEIDGQDYKLILSNWGGWKVTLDTKTGKELSYEFTK